MTVQLFCCSRTSPAQWHFLFSPRLFHWQVCDGAGAKWYENSWFSACRHPYMANCGSGNEAHARAPSFSMTGIYKNRNLRKHSFINLTKWMCFHISGAYTQFYTSGLRSGEVNSIQPHLNKSLMPRNATPEVKNCVIYTLINENHQFYNYQW